MDLEEQNATVAEINTDRRKRIRRKRRENCRVLREAM